MAPNGSDRIDHDCLQRQATEASEFDAWEKGYPYGVKPYYCGGVRAHD